jgi:adhesin transport system membrane fusion protein
MVAEVQIITGKQTIMEYILKPVLRARDVAMRER